MQGNKICSSESKDPMEVVLSFVAHYGIELSVVALYGLLWSYIASLYIAYVALYDLLVWPRSL